MPDSPILPGADWDELASRLAGTVVRAGDEQMILANKQFAARSALAIPQALIRCRSVDDARRSLEFVRRHDIPFALRSGGHCFGDLSASTGAVIDFGEMNSILPGHGPDGRTQVTVEPGVLAAEASAALVPLGQVLPTGGCPWVAIGGLGLVGGFGFLGRDRGLVTDQIERFQVLTAGGDLIDVGGDENADLFWALRGAGAGGLAAVTQLTLRTGPLPELTVLRGTWRLREAAALIEQWQHWAPDAEPSVNLEIGLAGPDDPDRPAFVDLFGVILGTPPSVAGPLSRVRSRLGALAPALKTWPLSGSAAAEYLMGLRDRSTAPAWQPCRPYPASGFQFTHSDFFEEALSRSAIDDCVARFEHERVYAQVRELEFIPWAGAYARPQADACFAHRKPRLLIRHTAMNGSRSTPDLRELSRTWVASSRAALQRHANGHVYQGYADLDLDDWAQAYYGPAYPRLQQVKRRYDPDQVFRHRQSVRPA